GAREPARGGGRGQGDGGGVGRGVGASGHRGRDGAPHVLPAGRRGRGQRVPAAGELKNVSFSNIVATDAAWTSSIMGIPGHPVTEVSLKGIRITARGGGSAEALAREVPEYEREYPDASLFSDVPAYGLYCRHGQRLRMERVDLKIDQSDGRPALVLDDVHEAD